MGLSVWRETSKKLTVYRVCYTPIETLYNGQNHMGFLKKSVAFGVPPAYSRYRRLRPRGENWLILC